MENKSLWRTGALLLALGAAFSASAADRGTADIVNVKGETIGLISLTEAPAGVIIHVKAQGLPAGAKAIHIHSVGDCSDHDKNFAASKGHVNVAGKKHGLMNPEGPDNGDLPNLFVHADGTVEAEFYTTLVSLGESKDRASLLDADGSAFVIHENRDDFITQPIGGAGTRIACAVIKEAK